MYLVTFDGSTSDYSSQIYILGLYDTKELANKAIDESLIKFPNELSKNKFKISKLNLNKTLDIIQEGSYVHWYETKKYLGGYSE